jgi:hypothetical protein
MCLSHWNQIPNAWKLGMRFLKPLTTIFRSQCCRGYGNILQLCVFWNIPCHSTWSRFVVYISLFSIGYKWHALVTHQDVHYEECTYHKVTDICWKCLFYRLEAYVSGGICRENEIILMMFIYCGLSLTLIIFQCADVLYKS